MKRINKLVGFLNKKSKSNLNVKPNKMSFKLLIDEKSDFIKK